MAIRRLQTAPALQGARDAGFELVQPEAPVRGVLAHRVATALVALALFTGLAATAAGLVGLPLEAGTAGAGLAGGVFAIAACVLLYGRGRAERTGLIVLGVAIVAACAIFHAALIDGGAQVLNQLFITIGDRTAVYALPYEAQSAAGLAFFCFVCSALIGAASAQLALRGGAVAAVVLAVATALAAVFGLVGIDIWTVLLALGTIGCLFCSTMLSGGSAHGGALAGNVVAALVGALLLLALAFGAFGVGLDTSGPRDAIRQAWYNALYGSGFAMPEGQLGSLGALEAGDRPALDVDVSGMSGDVVEYLRGYVGESYADSRWDTLSGDAVTGASDLFYWLGQEGFDTNSQLGTAAASISYADAKPGSMAVRNVGARGGYAYLPYGYESGASYTTTTDLATTRSAGSDDQSRVAFSVGQGLLQKAYLVQDALVKAQGKVASASASAASSGAKPAAAAGEDAAPHMDAAGYLAAESAYSKYVHEAYLAIPTDVAETFGTVFGKPLELDTEIAKAYVLQQLNEAVSYDPEAVTDNGDEDFVTYFLTESKAGYSVHYATVATLLMRYYGVPARYVEGYRLDTAAQSQAIGAEEAAEAGLDEKQVAALAEASSSNIALTEADAHAWVEYYLDGVGWLPFEVTPGFVDYDFYEVGPNTSMQLSGSAWWNSVSAASTWAPDVIEDEQTEESDSDSDASRFVNLWWVSLISFVLTLLAAAAVRAVLLRRRLARFGQSLADDEPAAAVPRAFSCGLLLAEECGGATLANEPYGRQAAAFADSGLADAGTFERAAAANARALFSRQGADEADREAALAFLAEVDGRLDDARGAFGNFVDKYVRCLR